MGPVILCYLQPSVGILLNRPPTGFIFFPSSSNIFTRGCVFFSFPWNAEISLFLRWLKAPKNCMVKGSLRRCSSVGSPVALWVGSKISIFAVARRRNNIVSGDVGLTKRIFSSAENSVKSLCFQHIRMLLHSLLCCHCSPLVAADFLTPWHHHSHWLPPQSWLKLPLIGCLALTQTPFERPYVSASDHRTKVTSA